MDYKEQFFPLNVSSNLKDKMDKKISRLNDLYANLRLALSKNENVYHILREIKILTINMFGNGMLLDRDALYDNSIIEIIFEILLKSSDIDTVEEAEKLLHIFITNSLIDEMPKYLEDHDFDLIIQKMLELKSDEVIVTLINLFTETINGNTENYEIIHKFFPSEIIENLIHSDDSDISDDVLKAISKFLQRVACKNCELMDISVFFSWCCEIILAFPLNEFILSAFYQAAHSEQFSLELIEENVNEIIEKLKYEFEITSDGILSYILKIYILFNDFGISKIPVTAKQALHWIANTNIHRSCGDACKIYFTIFKKAPDFQTQKYMVKNFIDVLKRPRNSAQTDEVRSWYFVMIQHILLCNYYADIINLVVDLDIFEITLDGMQSEATYAFLSIANCIDMIFKKADSCGCTENISELFIEVGCINELDEIIKYHDDDELIEKLTAFRDNYFEVKEE